MPYTIIIHVSKIGGNWGVLISSQNIQIRKTVFKGRISTPYIMLKPDSWSISNNKIENAYSSSHPPVKLFQRLIPWEPQAVKPPSRTPPPPKKKKKINHFLRRGWLPKPASFKREYTCPPIHQMKLRNGPVHPIRSLLVSFSISCSE